MSGITESNKKNIELGDIIEIFSPKNQEWHRHIFFIAYIDNTRIQIIHTATGRENYITEVTNDYIYRKSSTGNVSKIEYKIFETIYHRLLEVKLITREEINTEYTKRASAIITVILSYIPNIELIQKPKIAIRLL